MMATTPGFGLGKAKVNAIPGSRCCGKPVGCRITERGCMYLRHPWKRAVVLGDKTVRCQATGVDPDTDQPMQCVLMHGHEPPCVPSC